MSAFDGYCEHETRPRDGVVRPCQRRARWIVVDVSWPLGVSQRVCTQHRDVLDREWRYLGGWEILNGEPSVKVWRQG